MPKAKKNEPFNPKDLTPQEQLKFEIAQELGLGDKVIAGGLEKPDRQGERQDRRPDHQEKARDEAGGPGAGAGGLITCRAVIENCGQMAYT